MALKSGRFTACLPASPPNADGGAAARNNDANETPAADHEIRITHLLAVKTSFRGSKGVDRPARVNNEETERFMRKIGVWVMFAVLGFGSLAARADVIFEEGIEYANPDDQHLKLNLARPKDVKEGEQLPAVVCIHGGGFRGGD